MTLPAFWVFVTPLVGVVCAIGEALDMKAGLGAIILCATMGLVVGLGGAMCTVGLAIKVRFQRVRRESKLVSVGYVLAYFFFPPIVTAVTCVAIVWLASVIS